MIKLSHIILSALLAISVMSCSDDIDPSTLNVEQKALYNPDRPDADRDQDESRMAEKILTIAAVKPGMIVADLDGGSGYYTELFSSLVGEKGKVYLQNGQRFVSGHGEKLETRLKNGRLANVERIDSGYKDLKLPDGIDLIFISMAFHDVYVSQNEEEWNADIPGYFAQLKRALKEGGRLVIIDHSAAKGTGSESANKLHRIDEEFTRKSFENIGLTVVSSSDVLRNSSDDPTISIWNDKVSGKTDKFILVFSKAAKDK